MHIQQVISPGGIKAWFVEERTFPMLSIRIGFAGGASLDPGNEKAGRSQLMADGLEEGSGPYDAPGFRREVDAVALQIQSFSSRDQFMIHARMLSQNLERSLQLMRFYLAEPHFETDGVERARKRTVASLERSLEDPETVAALEWSRMAYPDDPYGRPVQGAPESVTNLTVEELCASHAGQFDRSRLKIGVIGDIGAGELGPALDRLLGGLPERTYDPPPPASPPMSRGIRVIERDVPQSAIRFGHAGLQRDDPDYIPAHVLNYIVGGGFDSWLSMEIRRGSRGLAYSASSHLLPLARAGILIGHLNTANETTHEAIELVRRIWKKTRETGPDADMLERAQLYLTGAYPLQFSSNAKIVRMLLEYQFQKLGLDYINQRNAQIEAVTLKDLRRVAERMIDPDALLFVVAGRPVGLDTDPH